jgi:hypothetical protein
MSVPYPPVRRWAWLFRRRPYRRPATPPDTPCRHCGRPVHSRPRRGLCRHCYADPAVRRCAPCDTHAARPLPAPADVAPGPAKVSLLRERARLRLSLFHPAELHDAPTGLRLLLAKLVET